VELGKLVFVLSGEAPELVAKPVRPHLQAGLWVSEIDPDLADTAEFCEHYDISLDVSANCVAVEARRAERTWRTNNGVRRFRPPADYPRMSVVGEVDPPQRP